MLNQDTGLKLSKTFRTTNIKLNFRSFTQVVILGNILYVIYATKVRHRRQVVEEILDIEIFSK